MSGLLDELLTTAEAAELLRVAPDTIKAWRAAGLPYYRLMGRTIRYDRRELEDWVREQQVVVRQVGRPRLRAVR